MKSSNLVYKYLIFIILSVATFILLVNLAFKFFTYSSSFEFFKEKFNSIKNKKNGYLKNNLPYEILVYNNPSYYQEINKILFPGINSEESVFFSKKNFKDSKEVKLKIYSNSRTYFNCKENESFFVSYYQKFKNSIIFPSVETEDAIIDNSINLRIRKNNDLIYFDSVIFEKNERLSFIYSGKLNLRIFYDNQFSYSYLERLLKKLEELEEGLINNPKFLDLENHYGLKLNEEMIYCIKKDDIKFEIKKKNINFFLFYSFYFEINDEKKLLIYEEIKNNINNLKNIKIKENRLFIKLKNEEIKKIIKETFFLPIILGNKKIKEFIEKLNNCKIEKDCEYLYYLENNIYLDMFSNLKYYFEPELLEKIAKDFEIDKFRETLIEFLILTNFLQSFDKKYCLTNLETLEENCFSIENTNNLNKMINDFKTKKDKESFLSLYKELEKIKSSNKEIKKLLEKNKVIIKNDEKGILIFINLQELYNYLLSNINIYPSNEIYYYPSVILNIEKMVKKNNKWIIIIE